MVHEPFIVSKPNEPHLPRHVCINVPKAPNHVPATIKPKYFRRYTLRMHK